jgi:hypothetical protein
MKRLACAGGLALSLLVAFATPARAALESQGDASWDGSTPPEGVYFHWYEPSFYTGFAPRTQDPARLHIRLSRGNQVRVTLPLGDAELDVYLEDLLARQAVVQELIDQKVITLTANKEWERFLEALASASVAEAAAAKASTSPEAYRQRSLEILTRLEPDRIFRVAIPLDGLLERWHAHLVENAAALGDSLPARLDAVNALLPGRIEAYELPAPTGELLARALAAAQSGPAGAPAFREAAQALLAAATGGRYAVRDGEVTAVEFTGIYPAGTIEGSTTYQGERLPEFGVTGIWPLIRRTQGRGVTGMVDYLSPNPGYGFITMLPYQHAGGITYNAFHNAGVRCQLNSTPFLPAAWRKVPGERDGAKPYQNLWIASRGPTSHGCTRLGSGHMSELRQIVPTDSEALEQVVTYRNKPFCYDVFDVEGDGTAEVIGVQYYLAYRSNDHTPVQAYAKNRREPFYRWLYGSNIEMGEVGKARLKSVPVCRFVGKKAEEARTLESQPLYEAKWARETIQFYQIKGIAPDSAPGFELNRELRKVGAGHRLDRKKLRLD